jgi:Cu(I)/Ag(I) efflux system membrane fusion protein
VIAGPLGDVVTTYESLRADLADDNATRAPALAKKIRASSLAASQTATTTKAQLDDVTKAATALKDIAATDVPAVRLAFGELSRAMIALFVADPTLQKGRHVFMCPMAKGFQKWVQPSDKLQNPYMGKKMLECGADSTWSVAP